MPYIPIPALYITTESNECRMAEATIWIGDRVVGYVGGSGYEDTVLEAAQEAIYRALAPLIQADPDVDRTSRFENDYYYGEERR